MPKKKNLPKGRKPTNEHQKMKYKLHFARALKNKARRHRNHIRCQPNDLQAIRAMAKRGIVADKDGQSYGY